jgi:hypothetical protein
MIGPDDDLTIAALHEKWGEIQRDMLRSVLGDRLIGSPFVKRGESIVFAPEGELLDTTIEDPVERAADALKRGGTMVVSREWLEE